MMPRLPAYPGSVLFAAALTLALPPHLPADVRASLLGKRLRIRILDAGVAFDFAWRGQHFAALRGSEQPDLDIGASARDFLALARRQEDPDTLFFSRRLAMVGDTELGLLVKNTLDGIDVPLTTLARQAMLRLLPWLPPHLKSQA